MTDDQLSPQERELITAIRTTSGDRPRELDPLNIEAADRLVARGLLRKKGKAYGITDKGRRAV